VKGNIFIHECVPPYRYKAIQFPEYRIIMPKATK
jgi:hypothetical protein